MLTIDDFKKPTSHPFGMMVGERQASEKEGFMAFFLAQCIKAGDIDAEIKTVSNEDYMEGLGYLKKVKKQTYQLTKKSKGLLFAYYGK
ncbi:hypothetical protein KAR91_32430 [Candidatus Pacearchaeota archaeon]|nr:hypothetical protein [Candidatus Pacearchaeota archaeon]